MSQEIEAAVQGIGSRIDEWKNRTEDVENKLKEIQAKGGRFSQVTESKIGMRGEIKNQIFKALHDKREAIAESADGQLMKPVEIKTAANMASANLATDNFISYTDWRPGMEAHGQFHFRNLVRTILSATDFVQFPRANTPLGEGSFGRQTEGATKSMVDRDYTMVEILLKPMAAYAIASRQSLRNIIFLQSWLPESMMNQLEESEDTDFANALVAAATGSTSTTKTVLPEKIISYMKNLIKAKYNPTAICVDPDVWEDLLCFRPGTDNPYSLPTPVTVGADGNIRLLNRQVIPVNWLTGRRILVGDFTKAAIIQSESLRLRTSDSHASIFSANEIAVLLERTEGLAIFRPDAFCTVIV